MVQNMHPNPRHPLIYGNYYHADGKQWQCVQELFIKFYLWKYDMSV